MKKKTTAESKKIRPKKLKRAKIGKKEKQSIRTVNPEIVDASTEADRDDHLPVDDTSLIAVASAAADSDSKSISTTDPLARYLSEIRQYPLLTKEQEKKLAIQYFDKKDPRAAEALVTSNLRFVVKVAAEYTKFGARLIDLVQEGNVGLMHAVKEFNPYKGARLITYAVWWIRGYIQEYLMRQYSLVRIGTTANQRKLFYQLQKEKDKLEKMGFTQDIKQLSGKLGIDQDEIEEMQKRLSGRDVSLDAPISDDGSGRMIDLQQQSGSDNLDEQLGLAEELNILKSKINEIKDKLTEKEKIILETRLLSDEPLTLQELGDRFGTTREAVRQIENRLMLKLKAAYTASNS